MNSLTLFSGTAYVDAFTNEFGPASDWRSWVDRRRHRARPTPSATPVLSFLLSMSFPGPPAARTHPAHARHSHPVRVPRGETAGALCYSHVNEAALP